MWHNGIASKETLAKLWYGSLLKLNSESDFSEVRFAVISSAKDLGMSSGEINIIEKAFDSVGIKSQTYTNTTTGKTVTFIKRTVHKKITKTVYPTNLDLSLPQLVGTYDGIPTINGYYDNREKEFTTNAENLSENDTDRIYVSDNSFVGADFNLETVVDNNISVVGTSDWCPSGCATSGNHRLYGDVFDLSTGKKLTLDDIFGVSRDEYLGVIYKKVSKCIAKDIADEGSGFSRYSIGSDLSSSNPSDVNSERGKKAIRGYNPDNFYITDKALVVFYETGDLGPNASGPFKFEIPFDSIKDILKIKVSMDDQATNSEPKRDIEQQANQSQEIVYINSGYGFTVTFPQTWKGYTAKSKFDDCIEFGFPDQGLFAICGYPKSKWKKIKAEQTDANTYLGENSQYVFSYSLAQHIDNATMGARSREIRDIVKTFSVTK